MRSVDKCLSVGHSPARTQVHSYSTVTTDNRTDPLSWRPRWPPAWRAYVPYCSSLSRGPDDSVLSRIHTSATEVRDRSRAAHGAFYSTISLPGPIYRTPARTLPGQGYVYITGERYRCIKRPVGRPRPVPHLRSRGIDGTDSSGPWEHDRSTLVAPAVA